MARVDSEDRRFVTSVGEVDSALADWADGHLKDFDTAALAEALYDGPHLVGSETRWYEREASERELAACEWKSWRSPLSCDARMGMRRERWQRLSPYGEVHVAVWVDMDGTASLLATSVREMGDSPWSQGRRCIADSTDPGTWGVLDQLFDGREEWQALLESTL